jgi:hypothetical protein
VKVPNYIFCIEHFTSFDCNINEEIIVKKKYIYIEERDMCIFFINLFFNALLNCSI